MMRRAGFLKDYVSAEWLAKATYAEKQAKARELVAELHIRIYF